MHFLRESSSSSEYVRLWGRFQSLNVLLVDLSASPSKNEKGRDAHYIAKPCGLTFILKFPDKGTVASLVVGTCHLGCSLSPGMPVANERFMWI